MAKSTRNRPMRTSPEFRQLINELRARNIMKGKKILSTSEITKIIANKLRKDGVLNVEFI